MTPPTVLNLSKNEDLFHIENIKLCKRSPITGLEWPRGFQEVKVPKFHDNGTGWW
jgi:hypothetical protein